MKVIISENQRGLLFKNGAFLKLLGPGKYHALGGRKIEVQYLEQPLHSEYASLGVLLRNCEIANQTDVAEAADEEIILHFVNGRFKEALGSGCYAFWNIYDNHEFQKISIASPEVPETFSGSIAQNLCPEFCIKVEVLEHQKARLYYDQKFVRLLDAGIYYFWKGKTKITVECVDTRVQQLNLAGQEILTRDRVSLRINFVCSYRITDYVRISCEIDDYKEQMHVTAQLALREYIGRYRLDEILENKEQMSACILKKLREKAGELYVEILDAGIKDIILPGEIREIMNNVLLAEKRAQANVITRREEVASTRSLLNTARLMDENKTLYKLKELEYLEKICENVGNITVNGSSDLLSQLARMMHETKG